jgi:hypothetical protein
MSAFTESIVEDAALAWLECLGYTMKTDQRSSRENFCPSG